MRILLGATLAALLLGSAAAQPSWADDTAPATVLFVLRPGVTISDGRFGPLRDFQQGLVTLLASCGKPVADPDKFADGKLGSGTRNALRALAACPAVASDPGVAAFVKDGSISDGLWRLVAKDTPPPDAMRRAYTMSGGNEATDYTDVEFNVGTSDPGILTWGPMGATAGQSFQVQRILQQIDAQQPGLIDKSFGTEAGAVRAFAKTRTEPAATEVIQAVKADAQRRQAWTSGFTALGEQQSVRKAYDALMNSRNTAGMIEGVNDFFRSYWAHCWRPTEVDFGYFLDRSIQLDVRQGKTDDAMKAVASAEKAAGHAFSAAERRRAIAANFPAGKAIYVGDRLARDVAYYLDGIPRAELTDESLLRLRQSSEPAPDQLNNELGRWAPRSSQRASDFGLSDDRPSPLPPTLTTAAPACIASAQ